jgi:hypothetical protein
VSRALKITIVILTVMVVAGLITLPSLRKAIEALSGSSRTAEQARREVMQVPISTPTDVNVKAQLYWLSAASPAALEPVEIELPLSENPVERSKQLINALIVKAPAPERRTLPLDVSLLAFYIRQDGTAIADFSDTLSTGTPSGILSEQRVVDSLTQTLGANVPGIRQLKILIHGQQAETLAGHLDLSGIFHVVAPATVGQQDPVVPAGPEAAAAQGISPLAAASPSPAPSK